MKDITLHSKDQDMVGFQVLLIHPYDKEDVFGE